MWIGVWDVVRIWSQKVKLILQEQKWFGSSERQGNMAWGEQDEGPGGVEQKEHGGQRSPLAADLLSLHWPLWSPSTDRFLLFFIILFNIFIIKDNFFIIFILTSIIICILLIMHNGFHVTFAYMLVSLLSVFISWYTLVPSTDLLQEAGLSTCC